MEYILRQNYHREELYAYLLLKDVLFQDRVALIGDDGTHGVPDLSTMDRKVCCEVTVSETMSVFDVIRKMFLGPIEKPEIDKLKLANVKYVNIKPAHIQPAEYKLDKVGLSSEEKEEYLKHFEYILRKKIIKLNKGTYRKSEKTFLIVLSDFKQKNNIHLSEIQAIYKNTVNNYRKKFDGVFVTLNNQLFLFNPEGDFKLIKNQQELLKKKNEFKKKILT